MFIYVSRKFVLFAFICLDRSPWGSSFGSHHYVERFPREPAAHWWCHPNWFWFFLPSCFSPSESNVHFQTHTLMDVQKIVSYLFCGMQKLFHLFKKSDRISACELQESQKLHSQTCYVLSTDATGNTGQLFPRLPLFLDLWPRDCAGGDTAVGSVDCFPAATQKGEWEWCVFKYNLISVYLHKLCVKYIFKNNATKFHIDLPFISRSKIPRILRCQWSPTLWPVRMLQQNPALHPHHHHRTSITIIQGRWSLTPIKPSHSQVKTPLL